MKELKSKTADLFLSNGVFEELKERFHGVNEEIASYLGDKVDDLFREDKKFQEYIEIHSRLAKLQGFALLEAEEAELSSWTDGYLDGKRAKRVQSWIDKHDGKYACLFLCVLGINGWRLKSSNSLLFVPDNGASDRVFTLISPLHDNIDMYTIDYYLEDIKSFTPERIEKEFEEWLKADKDQM